MTKPATAPIDTAAPRKRSVRRIVGLSALGVVSLVAVVAVAAAGVVSYTVQRSFPRLDGTVAVAGLTEEATVQRDELGIPTITAATAHDLFFAQGYVHAQDRFWEMDFRRHVTSGRLSELFGESQLATDEFLRTLGWRHVAEQEVADLDPTTRGYYDAYAQGVNAYLADHRGADVSLEYAILGLQNPDYEIEPWTPADSVAWLKAMAWDLRGNIEDETTRALLARDYSADELAELYPAYPFDRNPVIVPNLVPLPAPAALDAAPFPAQADAAGDDAATAADVAARVSWTQVDGVAAAVSRLIGDLGEGIGSNSWVVSGALTDTGLPILSNDPHLGAALPSVWHQVGLTCRPVTASCPFDVSGFSFSGLPGVVIGHNDRVAWGFTNLTTDVTDLYIERVDDDGYWYDGVKKPFERRTETFAVAGGPDRTIEVRSTGHGPIVSGLTDAFTAIADDPVTGSLDAEVGPATAPDGETGEYAVSLRWTALDAGTTASAVFALNTAQSFDDFRHAASLFDVPAQNLIYADIDGNIGYQTPGRLPIRGAGDGSMPQPGWDSAYDWTGYIPFDDLPVSLNPAEGFIVTANNAIVGPDYPYGLTRDWDYGWRAGRISDLIQRKAARGPLTVDDMRDIQADSQFEMGKQLATAYAEIATGDEKTDAALALLREWDAQNDADSAAAAYANVLWDELAQDLFVRERAHPVPLTDQGRWFLVVDRLLKTPASPWWRNPGLDASNQTEMLARAARDAYDRLVELQGDQPMRWNWGDLHALPLTSSTFGSSGIAPIEMLFNRGPYPVGGGSSLVDATGWDLGSGGFSTVTVPSMRMIVDLADFDRSRWNHLTGTSGHAFHPNYVDQTSTWQSVQHTPWAFSPAAVEAAAVDTLVLTPKG